MYNLYNYEKKLKEDKKKLREFELENKIKQKRKKDLDAFSERYERRIKDFVYNMASTSNPVIITDYTSPVENTRSLLIQEENEKIKGKHGFVFNNFKTEKQRIEEYLKNKEIEKNIQRNTSIIKNLGLDMLKNEPTLNKNPIKWNSGKTFQQPTMRYKPKSDMERVIDTVEKNRGTLIDKSFLKKKTTTMRKNTEESGSDASDSIHMFLQPSKRVDKKDKTIEILNLANEDFFMEKDVDKDIYNDELSPTNHNKKKHGFFTSNFTKNSTTSTTKFLKRKDNYKAKEILKEFYKKSHFKGAIDLALFKVEDTYKNPTKDISKGKFSGHVIPHIKKSKHSLFKEIDNDNDNDNISTMTKSVYRQIRHHRKELTNKFGNFEYISSMNARDESEAGSVKNDKDDFLKTNPLIFSMFSNNPLKSENKTYTDRMTLKELEKIAFPLKTDLSDKDIERKNMIKVLMGLQKKRSAISEVDIQKLKTLGITDLLPEDYIIKKRDDDKIFIGQEVFDKTRVDLIAGKILKTCNYFHHKNKNAPDSLKKNSGKTMITNGLSIEEFLTKHHLKH